MKPKKSKREIVWEAALKEFSSRGYAGARMEAIAKKAKVNKAMIFYYYASKKNLYKEILKQVIGEILEKFISLSQPEMTSQKFIEAFPRMHIHFLKDHQEYIRLIGFDLLQNPHNFRDIVQEIIAELPNFKKAAWIPNFLKEKCSQGEFRETEVSHLLLNIVSLTVFTFIGWPMVEIFSGSRLVIDDAFYEKRIQSIIQVLQEGVLV